MTSSVLTDAPVDVLPSPMLPQVTGFVMSLASDNTLTDRDQRALERILDGFQKVLSRADTQFSRVRKHGRKPFRGIVSIFCSEIGNRTPPQDHQELPIGWTYSLSQGGVGLVSLEAAEFDDVSIGLHLPGGKIRWIPGRIVRRRKIPEERFFDYGVAFGTGP